MSWFTPDVIDTIFAVVKAIVVLLAVVVCGALLSFVERRLLGRHRHPRCAVQSDFTD